MRCYGLNSTTPLEKKLLAAFRGSSRGDARWSTFANGEIFVRVGSGAEDAIVLGRTAPPAEDLVRTLLLIDTLRRGGSAAITAVIPYFGYARQDRQASRGDSCASALLTSMLACAGATRIVTVDVHSEAVTASSRVPFTSVSAIPDLAMAFELANEGREFMVIAPDFGARFRADAFAAALAHRDAAWVEKRRDAKTGAVSLIDVHGDLRGDVAVIVDDMLDTGATVEMTVDMLRQKKFSSLYLCVTHGLFTADAVARIKRLRFEKIFVSNTVPLSPAAAKLPGLSVVDVSRRLLFAMRSDTTESGGRP